MPNWPELNAFAETMGLSLQDDEQSSHLAAALTRCSWNLENGLPNAPNHESLEWLGDRILGALVASELWRRFPGTAPGRLDLARDKLTSAKGLAKVGRELNLQAVIRMGKGERQQGQVRRDKAISDHVEALIAAVFLTQGWAGANTFTLRLLSGHLPEELPAETARLDGASGSQAMTALSELVQRKFKRSLDRSDWTVEQVSGPDNAPTHQAEVTLPDDTTHKGQAVPGKKKAAQASAAVAALQYLRDL